MDESDGLEIRYASYSAIEWLDPMKEAPSFEGASLVSATPPIGKAPVWGTGDGGGVVSGPDGSPNFGPSGSSSGTWNLAWNFGL